MDFQKFLSSIDSNLFQVDVVGLLALILSLILTIKELYDSRFRLSFVNPMAYLVAANGGEKLYQILDVTICNLSNKPASLPGFFLVTPDKIRIPAEIRSFLFYRQGPTTESRTQTILSPAREEWTVELPIILAPYGALRVQIPFQLTSSTIKSLYHIDVSGNIFEQLNTLQESAFRQNPDESPCKIIVCASRRRPKRYTLAVRRRTLEDVFDVIGLF